MKIYVKISSISIFSLFFWFSIMIYHIHWLNPYHSFKHSYSVLACCLRCRGLRDSFAVKATLKIPD